MGRYPAPQAKARRHGIWFTVGLFRADSTGYDPLILSRRQPVSGSSSPSRDGRETAMRKRSDVERIVKAELSKAFKGRQTPFDLDWDVTDDEVAEPVLNISVRLPQGERPEITRTIAMLPITIRQALAESGTDVLVHVWFPDDEVAEAAD
ncbi:hypothetical protein [Elioraea thermophila]|uniref:hypothetical protein n=1 Tax=Elioraea thermophila TaxID=2185104 RepID=UPI001300B928|nr:hypothetical protein [Elioraea thermophila]